MKREKNYYYLRVQNFLDIILMVINLENYNESISGDSCPQPYKKQKEANNINIDFFITV